MEMNENGKTNMSTVSCYKNCTRGETNDSKMRRNRWIKCYEHVFDQWNGTDKKLRHGYCEGCGSNDGERRYSEWMIPQIDVVKAI